MIERGASQIIENRAKNHNMEGGTAEARGQGRGTKEKGHTGEILLGILFASLLQTLLSVASFLDKLRARDGRRKGPMTSWHG